MKCPLQIRSLKAPFTLGVLFALLLFLVGVPTPVHAQWTKISIKKHGRTVALNPYFITMEGATLFMGTNNAGMWESTDTGATWEVTEVPSGVSQFMRQDGELFVVQVNSGPYRSTDAGGTWTPAADSLPTERWPVFHSLAEHEGSLYIAVERTATDSYAQIRELYRSEDDAATWEFVHAFENGIGDIWSGNGKLYVTSKGLHQSTDDGVTFEPVEGEVRKPIAEAGGKLIASGEHHVYISEDGGETWVGHDEGFDDWTRPHFGLAVQGNHIFVVGIPVGRSKGKLYMASLDDMIFTEVSDSLSGEFSGLLGVHGGRIWVKSGSAVYHRSISDFGLSSPPAAAPALVGPNEDSDVGGTAAISWHAVDEADTYDVQLATDDAFTDLLRDETGLADTQLNVSVDYSTTYHWRVRAVNAGGAGPWATAQFSTSTGVAIEHGDASLPREYALHGNYPNPFNPATTIRFDLPEAAPVTVKVYDAIGRLVDTLVDESLSAGRYRYSWSAGDRSSGLYLYRLESPGFIGHGSMLLVK